MLMKEKRYLFILWLTHRQASNFIWKIHKPFRHSFITTLAWIEQTFCLCLALYFMLWFLILHFLSYLLLLLLLRCFSSEIRGKSSVLHVWWNNNGDSWTRMLGQKWFCFYSSFHSFLYFFIVYTFAHIIHSMNGHRMVLGVTHEMIDLNEHSIKSVHNDEIKISIK